MKTLEVNQSEEWLRVLSPLNFDGIAEEDRDAAASDYTDHLMLILKSAGYHAIRTTYYRCTCHGWNEANTFRHKLGPVGTFDELTRQEIEQIESICHDAEKYMRHNWVALDG